MVVGDDRTDFLSHFVDRFYCGNSLGAEPVFQGIDVGFTTIGPRIRSFAWWAGRLNDEFTECGFLFVSKVVRHLLGQVDLTFGVFGVEAVVISAFDPQ